MEEMDYSKWNYGYIRNWLEEQEETDPDYTDRAATVLDCFMEIQQEKKAILDQWNAARQITDKTIANLEARENALIIDKEELKKENLKKDADLIECVKIIDLKDKQIRELKDKIMELEKQVSDNKDSQEYIQFKGSDNNNDKYITTFGPEDNLDTINKSVLKEETDEDKLKKLYNFLDSKLNEPSLKSI
ncbi:hypothetical protein [uncultured Clostridium sp.]|uniref:hypothetical protein n=1 Tax=uncultured Clostridium sp. TaxID=59620 RepID=UPI0026374F70|nr:hypothetical protein [uncultured Clostridium sp.]